MKILVLDNYDSFVYNLVHLIYELGFEEKTEVHRNDKISLEEVEQFDKILLSPGPGLPKDAGIMPELIQKYAATKSILGVCLGHQAIAEAFGAELINLPKVLHGVSSNTTLQVTDDSFFSEIPESFQICHYHSWSVKPGTLKSPLELTALDDEGNIMALRHQEYSIRGVQFHPESILTENGKEMMLNWLLKC